MIRRVLTIAFSILAFTADGQDQVRLNLAEAEAIALKNNPAIGAAEFGALAAKERIEQAEAARQPFVTANLTGAGAPEDTRLAAGALNNPIIYSRLATGVSISQLLFDFGRTSQLVQTSKYASQADRERTRATKADVVLNVRRAYYAAHEAKFSEPEQVRVPGVDVFPAEVAEHALRGAGRAIGRAPPGARPYR